jgi:RNA polymerase sigma-70 factor (ECF subfamily)
MENSLAIPRPKWKSEYLEDTSSLRLVLEYYDREQVPLLRYLAFLNVDRETAQEIVQDCFIKLHEHLKADGDSSNLRAWLYRVAHNLARNSQTSARARRTERLADMTAASEPVSRQQSVEEALLEREKSERVQQCLQQLTDAQRQALVLRSQGLKYREIAQTLGLSVSTVAENIQRGMDKLRQIV